MELVKIKSFCRELLCLNHQVCCLTEKSFSSMRSYLLSVRLRACVSSVLFRKSLPSKINVRLFLTLSLPQVQCIFFMLRHLEGESCARWWLWYYLHSSPCRKKSSFPITIWLCHLFSSMYFFPVCNLFLKIGVHMCF